MPRRAHLLMTGILLLMLAMMPLQCLARDLYFSPLFSYTSEDGEYTLDGLGPIIDYSNDHQALRPLYYKDVRQDTTTILYPLGKDTKDHSYFIPFMRSRKEVDHPYLDIFPYFSGTYEGKGYHGLFPVYGHFYGRYGYDEAGFVLWPLYSRTEKSGAITTSLLWPVFSYRERELFRVFPLYGVEKTADSEYTFFLWPVFHREKRPDGGVVAALPLFRYETGPEHWNASFLWPFFTYNRDAAANHTSMDFPWPVIRIARGGYEETRLFPLYWSRDEGRVYQRHAVLWPLWSTVSSSGERPGETEKTTAVLILNRFTEITSGDGMISRSQTIWPLVHCTQEQDRSTWAFPALIPFYADEGFSRTWGDFLTLAQGSEDGESSRTSLLWKSFYWEQGPGRSFWSLLFLASHRTTAEYSEWGFLGNLIRFRGTPGPAPQASP